MNPRLPRPAASRRRAAVIVLHAAGLAFLLGGAAPAARAQNEIPVIDETEDLDFDDPQSWAMQFYGSVSMLTPLGAPVVREPGSVDLALEVSQVPHLSADERRVGFGGVKEEDLNRLPVFVRPRVAVGLPHRFAIEVGYVPPIEVEGIEPNLLSLAIDHVFYVGKRWSFGGRLHGQIGDIQGDLTCSEEDASHPIGSPGNLYGCRAPSNDEATLDHIGLRLGAGYQVRGAGGPTFTFGAGGLHHDLEFQVDALTFGVHDRTLLLADGYTWALDAGMAIPLAQRTQLGFEVLWSPLEVVRPPKTSAQTDELLHLKGLVRYRVR
jgi:hypothetical protein